jgi:ComF family protein
LNIVELTHRITSPLLDFIYPPVCIACNKPLPDGKQKVCIDCWNAIPQITKQLPLYQETRAKLLTEGYINDLVSCFVFEKEGSFQHIAHALKYNEYKSMGVELGKRIGALMQNWDIEADIIVPVPLHSIKQRERGYNQAELIASGIASIISKPIVTNAVYRTRHTQTQTKLTLEERRKNMENAFKTFDSVSKILNGKSCLLVDDVITTGATTNSCAKVLSLAGTTTIISASAAIAQ